MSLATFQRLMVELTLSPGMVRRLRAGELADIDGAGLTDRERGRLLAIVQQPGISIHCTLSRGNRLEAIAIALPMTCTLIEPIFRPLLDAFWEESPPSNYQLTGMDHGFARFLRGKIDACELEVEYLSEIVDYETLCLALRDRRRVSADGGDFEAFMEFQHDPDRLLPPLSRLALPPPGLPIGAYPSRVTLREDRFVVEPCPAQVQTRGRAA